MGHDWGSNEQSNTHGNLSWGSKVGEIRSYGTSNMILIACFQQFFFIFRIFFTPKNTISPRIFFSIKQDTFLTLKLLITFLKELGVGQGSFSAKCTGLIPILCAFYILTMKLTNCMCMLCMIDELTAYHHWLCLHKTIDTCLPCIYILIFADD